MKKEELFGNAEFVCADAECVSTLFKGTFTVDSGRKTEITVCGLGFFRLYVNGRKVSDDILAPVTSFYHPYDDCICTVRYGEEMKSRIYCMKYDITEFVRSGENTVLVSVGQGWYGRLYNKDKCVLCYKIENGSNTFYSGTDVKWLDSPVTYYDFTKGEKQDFTKHNYDISALTRDCSEWRNTQTINLPETEYYIQNIGNDKVIRSITPAKISEKDGLAVYDNGENITGSFVFVCPQKNRTVSVRSYEKLDENGCPDEKFRQGQEAEFVCDGSDREYHLLFTWHAFRYFTVPADVNVIRTDVIHMPVESTSSFRCENEVLNWLYETYIRTQLCNMHNGIPSDCPHLERRGYTGDGQLTCEAAMMMTDSKDFYLKWMEDIADCQDIHSGHIQYTAPYVESGGGPGGWGCAIAEVPYIFYKMYGDIQPAKKYFDGMLFYLDYLEAHSENDLVVSDQPGLWCLGEWCTPHEKHGERPLIPAPFVNNYFYIRTIDRMVEMASVIGREECIPGLLAVKERKVKALVDNYYDSSTGDFAKNLNSADAFALDLGLGDERTLAHVVESVRTKPVDTGIFGTDLVPKLLFENGYFDEAVDFLSRNSYPSFGHMMKCGATTIWEDWQNPRSMFHPMFGSAVKYLFMYILGIRRATDSCGYEKVIIEPKTNDATGNASGYITTAKGVIGVSIDREKNLCTVTVPDGIEAEIIFDGTVDRRQSI